jgi:hypothetical protein
MMPTIADTKKPPGITPGTKYSAIHAHAAATIKKNMKPRMPIMNYLNHSHNGSMIGNGVAIVPKLLFG